jgi:hypothetical protein
MEDGMISVLHSANDVNHHASGFIHEEMALVQLRPFPNGPSGIVSTAFSYFLTASMYSTPTSFSST